MKKVSIITIDLLIIILVTCGIVIDLCQIGTPSGRWHLFIYFTIQSNLLIAFLAILGVYGLYHKTWYLLFRTGVTLNILITFLGFHFLLSKLYHPVGMAALANLLLHYVVPALALLNWLILVQTKRLTYGYIAAGFVYPAIYLISSLVRGALTDDYPYWFIRPYGTYPDGVGSYLGVLMVSLALISLVGLLGLILIWLNRKLYTPRRKMFK